MINLRRMGRAKPAPFAVDHLTQLSPIQTKMLEFYNENPRAAIIAPRQCGKSTFIAMQAVLSKNKNTLIICHSQDAARQLANTVETVCNQNKIKYKKSHRLQTVIITIAGYHIQCSSRNILDRSDFSGFNEVFVDEFYFIDMDLPLYHIENVILIGSNEHNREPINMDASRTGVFAGLNINED